MKKTYKAPKVKITSVRMSSIIANSNPTLNSDYGKNGGPRLGKDRGDFFEEEESISWP